MVNTPDERLLALMTIVDYSLHDKLVHLYKKNNIPIVLLTHGHGSAKPSIFDILGYGGPKKIVCISIQTKSMANFMMGQLSKHLEFNKPGTGIVFTIQLSSVSSVLRNISVTVNENAEIGSEIMPSKEPYHLIITIVNSGHAEQVMDAARAAGAGGGTIIRARGLGSKEAVKYLGITIQPEKDLVLILTPRDSKRPIMENIVREAGLTTAGAGICFSLPVDTALGINALLEQAENA
jgi:nitrogen regulatory protein PII